MGRGKSNAAGAAATLTAGFHAAGLRQRRAAAFRTRAGTPGSYDELMALSKSLPEGDILEFGGVPCHIILRTETAKNPHTKSRHMGHAGFTADTGEFIAVISSAGSNTPGAGRQVEHTICYRGTNLKACCDTVNDTMDRLAQYDFGADFFPTAFVRELRKRLGRPGD